jgi:glycosyltransferase involved in cell wall biosynthesis
MKKSSKRPMVVIVNGLVNPIPPVKGGGPQIVIWNTCQELYNTFFDWRVLSLWDKGVEDCEFDRERFIQVKPTSLERKLVALTRILPYRLVKSIFGVYRPDHLLLNLSMIRYLKHLRPDLLVVHDSYSFTNLYHFLFPSANIILYHHNSKLHQDLTEKQWDRLNHSATAGIIAICSTAFEYTDAKFKKRPTQKWVILNGVGSSFPLEKAEKRKNELRIDFNIHQNEYVFLYIGRINRIKGLEILIESFSEVEKQSRRPVRLMIVGSAAVDEDGSFEFEKQLIRRAKAIAPDKINFIGFVPNDELADYYQMSDCGVLPTHLLEGNSLFLMECLTMGLPVIATKIGGVPEVVRENLDGILIEEKNLSTHLTPAMLSFIDEHKKWEGRKTEISKAARERFNYQRVAQEFSQVIDSVLTKNETKA